MSGTLLIVGGGAEAVPGIRRAKGMGLRVAVVDGSPVAPGFAFADDAIIVSTYDVHGVLGAARDYDRLHSIDGVIAMAADVPQTVSAVADALRLPGIPAEAAALAADKLAMKRRLDECRVPVPWFRSLDSLDDLYSAMEERGLPLVLKPVDSRGARGVLRLTESTDLEQAFEHARSKSPTSRVMAEEFIPGPQVSTESVILETRAITPGFIDRNYEHLERNAPWMIENGGQQPTGLDAETAAAVRRTAEDAARALGIVEWTAKGDIVVGPDGPTVIEMAARLSGGWMSSDQIQLATGVDFLAAAIALSLGESPSLSDLEPRVSVGVAIRYAFPTPGRVTAVGDISALAELSYVHRIDVAVGIGDTIELQTDHTKRAGFVITTGDTAEEAVSRAEDVIDRFDIATEQL